jgi:hypothetical protein
MHLAVLSLTAMPERASAEENANDQQEKSTRYKNRDETERPDSKRVSVAMERQIGSTPENICGYLELLGEERLVADVLVELVIESDDFEELVVLVNIDSTEYQASMRTWHCSWLSALLMLSARYSRR